MPSGPTKENADLRMRRIGASRGERWGGIRTDKRFRQSGLMARALEGFGLGIGWPVGASGPGPGLGLGPKPKPAAQSQAQTLENEIPGLRLLARTKVGMTPHPL